MRLINHPVLCNYYLTYKCNATCSFCDIWERPTTYARINEIKSNLKALKRLGVKVVDFTGGEPLLHPQIAEILYEAKQLKLITTVTTNTLLYPKKAKEIQGLVDMLHFSLDSANPEQHNAMRGVACFDYVIKSIEIAKNLGERPDILFTVFKGNLNQIKPVYEQICLPNKLVLLLNPAFDYNSLQVEDNLTKEELHMLSQWGKKKFVYLNEAFIALRKAGGNAITDPVCKAASSSLVISPDNQLVLPCYHLGKQSFTITNDLFTLYNSSKVKELIKMEGKYAECAGCTINCYMQPSFAVTLNRYWFRATPSTIKYNYLKSTWKHLF